MGFMQVSKLVGGLRDTHGLVDYKPFMGRLFTRAQQAKQQVRAQPAQRGGQARLSKAGSHLNVHSPGPHVKSGGRHQGVAAAAAEEIQLPNWAAARQRRWVMTARMCCNGGTVVALVACGIR
jgi:hypothetical protein